MLFSSSLKKKSRISQDPDSQMCIITTALPVPILPITVSIRVPMCISSKMRRREEQDSRLPIMWELEIRMLSMAVSFHNNFADTFVCGC